MANKENIEDWVAALRSGGFQQARHSLRLDRVNENGTREPAGYCCLGVACEVAIKDGLGIIRDPDGYKDPAASKYSVYSGALPPGVVNWLGLTDDKRGTLGDFTVKYDDAEHFLATLNDDHRLTFEQIADVIEDNFLKENQ